MSDTDGNPLDRRAVAAGIAAAAFVFILGLTLFAGASEGAPDDTADLSIAKTDSPDPVSVGAALTYSIQVANAGPDTATEVVVTDDLPKGVSFVSADPTQGSCALSSNKRRVTCKLGTIGVVSGPVYSPPGVDYSPAAAISIRVLAPKKAGSISNKASVKGLEKDPKSGNDKATATTRVIAAPKAGKGPTCRGRRATLIGTVRADVLTGTAGRDVVVARRGGDRIATLGGSDLVCAGTGNDVTNAGARSDRVLAGPGADRVLGKGGSDTLKGGRGPDRIRGGRGADLLAGGPGRDRCFGGPGADSFRSC
ncbi:MAG TPA: hypothetical protein VIT85_04350 [Solirubrobacterales bacterium]